MIVRLCCLLMTVALALPSPVVLAAAHAGAPGQAAGAGTPADCPGHMAAASHVGTEHGNHTHDDGAAHAEPCSEACLVACVLAGQVGGMAASAEVIPCACTGERPPANAVRMVGSAGEGPFRPPRFPLAH